MVMLSLQIDTPERWFSQVDENLEKTRKLLEYYDTYAEQQAFIERMIRYFNKERKVTEFTIEKLKALKAGMAVTAASEP